jgi:hypothetical protein
MVENYGFNMSTTQVDDVNAQKFNIITSTDSTTVSVAASSTAVVGELTFVPQYTGTVLVEGFVIGAGGTLQIGISKANGKSGSEVGTGAKVVSASTGTTPIGLVISGLTPYSVYYIGVIVDNSGTSAISAKGVLSTAQELSTGVIRG